MKACVCDIGGTNFRIALYEDGEIKDITKLKTPNFFQYSEEEIKVMIIELIAKELNERIEKDSEIDRLGVCFPGPVNKEGEALGSSVIFGTTIKKKFALRYELQKRFPNVIVEVMNDITAAAYRYMGNGNFCLITVSSGIGNKIVIDDRVVIDNRGRTGEIGHYSIDGYDVDIECTCGTGKNHVGMISSGRGVELMARQFATHGAKYYEQYLSSIIYKECDNNKLITAEMVAKAADKGDEFAMKVVDYCTKPLAAEICLLAIALDIPSFIIIGGFALNCQYYIKALVENVKKKGIYNFSDNEIEEMIKYGENDDNHGLIGAGILVTNK